MASKKLRDILIEDTEALKTSMIHTNGHVNCIVVDEASSTWGYRNISSSLIPDKSIPILDGELTHLLRLDGEKLWPIDYTPTDNEDKTPQDCFEAQCWDELAVILSLDLPWSEKIKLGVFVALAFGFMILLFLIGTVAMEGG